MESQDIDISLGLVKVLNLVENELTVKNNLNLAKKMCNVHGV